MEPQKTANMQIAKAIPSKKNNTGGIMTPDLKLYFRAIAIKNSMVLAQKQTQRPTEQNRRPKHKSMQLKSPGF
jgi:hypothetical protein